MEASETSRVDGSAPTTPDLVPVALFREWHDRALRAEAAVLELGRKVAATLPAKAGPSKTFETTAVTLSSPRQGAFAIMDAGAIDEHWITPHRSGTGQGTCVDVYGEHAREVADLHREYPISELADGGIRIKTPTAQFAHLIQEKMHQRATREGWTIETVIANLGSSSLVCRDAARGIVQAQLITDPDLKGFAIAAKALNISVSRDLVSGRVVSVTIVPVS